MKTRTFKGDSVHALMRQVREELGDNVVILGTREGAESGVEIEIALMEDSSDEVMFDCDLPEPSLSTLAEVYRESSATSALDLNGFSAELKAACTPYLRGAVVDSDRLSKALGKVLPIDAAIPATSRVISLVGPTGAGKTTSIAKLTARLQVAFGMKIGLVAGDSYRVGAEFHLGAFASLLGVPLATFNERLPLYARLPEALGRLDGCDLIFVDTPGSGPFDEERFEELSAMFSATPKAEKILVLPAPGNEADLGTAAAAYLKLGCSRVMITKLDESGYLGPVLNTVHRSRLPLAFLATGQRVPDDIEPASARRLAWMLMRRMH